MQVSLTCWTKINKFVVYEFRLANCAQKFPAYSVDRMAVLYFTYRLLTQLISAMYWILHSIKVYSFTLNAYKLSTKQILSLTVKRALEASNHQRCIAYTWEHAKPPEVNAKPCFAFSRQFNTISPKQSHEIQFAKHGWNKRVREYSFAFCYLDKHALRMYAFDMLKPYVLKREN